MQMIKFCCKVIKHGNTSVQNKWCWRMVSLEQHVLNAQTQTDFLLVFRAPWMSHTESFGLDMESDEQEKMTLSLLTIFELQQAGLLDESNVISRSWRTICNREEDPLRKPLPLLKKIYFNLLMSSMHSTRKCVHFEGFFKCTVHNTH